MSGSLSVDSGEDYRVDSGVTETYSDIEYMAGELTVEGTLILDGTEPRPVSPDPQINLPMDIELEDMNMGIAIFLVGMLSITLSAAWVLRNYAAGVMWGIGVIVLIVAGTMGLGLEIFWMIMVLTAVLLVIGMVIRWSS